MLSLLLHYRLSDITDILNHINPINHSSDSGCDIIKAHSGELKVETKEGEFAGVYY